METKYNIGQTLIRKVEAPDSLPASIKIKEKFKVEIAYYSNPLGECTTNNSNHIMTHSSHISYLTDNSNQFEEQILDNWYEIQ